MTHHRIFHILTPAVAFAALVLTSSPARAEVGGHVDADFDLGAPMDGGDLAPGVGGRFGWRFNLGPVWLQPEAGGSYVGFLCFDCDDLSAKVDNRHVARVFGGARLGGSGLVAKVIEPSLFGHAGYGWINASVKGPAFDVGFSLDVVAVRYFRFGVQGAYNVVASQADTGRFAPVPVMAYLGQTTSKRWVSFGLHTGVAF